MTNREAAAASERNDLLLIEAVLNGYPGSMARADALAAVRRLLADRAASERPTEGLAEWLQELKRSGLARHQWDLVDKCIAEVEALAASAPQAVRMLSQHELLELVSIYYECNIDPELAIRKFCEVNGIVPLAPQDSTKEGTNK